MHFTRFIRRSASVLVLASAAAGAAHAQDAQTIDSIIVTAQKREQNLQDVPIVVTALPQQLQSLGADSLPHAGAKLI